MYNIQPYGVAEYIEYYGLIFQVFADKRNIYFRLFITSNVLSQQIKKKSYFCFLVYSYGENIIKRIKME